MIHSVTAQPYTTSLIVRSPAVKDRFLVTDRTTGQAWWQHGAATESPDEAARKRMNAAHANACLRQLTELGGPSVVRREWFFVAAFAQLVTCAVPSSALSRSGMK